MVSVMGIVRPLLVLLIMGLILTFSYALNSLVQEIKRLLPVSPNKKIIVDVVFCVILFVLIVVIAWIWNPGEDLDKSLLRFT
jgi:predicted PurR-regulated permease PerM